MNENIPEIEEWRPIPGWDRYEVSSLGQVRSIDDRVRPNRRGRILKQCKEKYLTVSLTSVGVKRNCGVHTLVAAAFLGPKPPGTQCCHNNGNRFDNRAVNLRFDTPFNNDKDKIVHGTRIFGERHHRAILTWEHVAEIRQSPENTDKELAAKFGVHRSTVTLARLGRTWNQPRSGVLIHPPTDVGGEGV